MNMEFVFVCVCVLYLINYEAKRHREREREREKMREREKLKHLYFCLDAVHLSTHGVDDVSAVRLEHRILEYSNE